MYSSTLKTDNRSNQKPYRSKNHTKKSFGFQKSQLSDNWKNNVPIKQLVIDDFVKKHDHPLIAKLTHQITYTTYGMYTHLWKSENLPILDNKFRTVRLLKNRASITYKKYLKAHSIKKSAIEKSAIAAYNFLATVSKHGKQILIVGTRPYIQEYVRKEADRAKINYVTNRWLGGMLTNLLTVRSQIRVMNEIKKSEINGSLARLSKNEIAKTMKKYNKLKQIFNGILLMNSVPDCVVVLTPRENKIAIQEAKKLQIPVVALVNTGDSPRDIDYPIYTNNFYKKSLYLWTTIICDAIVEGHTRNPELKFAFRDDLKREDFLDVSEIEAEKQEKLDAETKKVLDDKPQEIFDQSQNAFEDFFANDPNKNKTT